MNRIQIARRAAARRTIPLLFNDNETTWLEFGSSELRLKREGGEPVWSTALPDASWALGGPEFSSGDLDTFDPSEREESA